MYKSGSTKLVRNLNKQHILNLVRMSQGISAREISNETKLQMSTVLYTLQALRDEGLVLEVGFGNSTLKGGKPPVIWDIAPDYGYIIGAELLSKEVRFVLLDFNSSVLDKATFKIKFSKDPDDISDQFVARLKEFVQANKIPYEKILGCGIGIPGSIDFKNGIVLYSYTFEFRNVGFKRILEEKLGFQVEIDNDANAGALGIKWLSKKFQMTKNILFVSINQHFAGMGVGFIINHHLYHGFHSAAGEIKGFLTENLWTRLLTNAVKKFPEGCFLGETEDVMEVRIAEVIGAAKEGDQGSIFILREVAKEISKKLTILIDLLDPEWVVIGGDMVEAEDFISGIIRERIKANVVSEITRNTPVGFSQFGATSGAMGGAALIFQKVFGFDARENM